VYQIELSLGQVLGRDIVRDGLEVLLANSLKESNVDIGGCDVTVNSDLPAEPLCGGALRYSSSVGTNKTPRLGCGAIEMTKKLLDRAAGR
jgi:hypothetical protein